MAKSVIHMKHPDKLRAEIRERVEARSRSLIDERRGWRHNHGYTVTLYRAVDGGRVFRHAGSYADAVLVRDAELALGPFEKAWITERTGQAGEV